MVNEAGLRCYPLKQSIFLCISDEPDEANRINILGVEITTTDESEYTFCNQECKANKVRHYMGEVKATEIRNTLREVLTRLGGKDNERGS